MKLLARRTTIILALALGAAASANAATTATTKTIKSWSSSLSSSLISSPLPLSSSSLNKSISLPKHGLFLLSLRGGGESSSASGSTPAVATVATPPTKTKKKKKTKTKTTTTSATTSMTNKKKTKSSKNVIDNAMRQKDAAEALGDAIRDRADILRSEDPLLASIDGSVSSLGQAMGASDYHYYCGGGGVQASPSSVVANYFLKSHGGAHALQCVCSALAMISAMAMMSLASMSTSSNNKNNNVLVFTFLQRTLFFAMMKHVSGLLASASIAAKAIPKIGLSQARQWMEQIVLDPVSQYVFYTALLLLWLPSKQRLPAMWWWQQKQRRLSSFLLFLTGPIVLRESISNLLVLSDVLVLWSVGGHDNNNNNHKNTTSSSGGGMITTILKVSNSIVNAIMSLLVSPGVWRNANAAQRQAILSKLIGRVSLVMEVVVGMILLYDLLWGMFAAAFYSGDKRPPFVESLKRILVTRLYAHYLWIRKSQISKVALEIRGGAAKLPLQVLDVLYEPAKAMGVARTTNLNPEDMTWKDYAVVGLGLDV